MAIAIAVLFTACPVVEKDQEELLTQKKGWTMLTATSDRAYTNFDGISSENLFVSFFYECELDDILHFDINKSSKMDFGKDICDDQTGKEVGLGNWKFKSEKVLEYHLPYFFDDNDNFALLEGAVVVLDETTLTIRVPVEFYDDPVKGSGKIRNDRGIRNAKGDADKYNFTFTYKAK